MIFSHLHVRDIEFDLENDQFRCLYGLDTVSSERPKLSDVQRVTEIYDDPTFFLGGPDANDVKQGRLGDCWFLSALSMMSTSKGLVEKFCVAVSCYSTFSFRQVHITNRSSAR